MSEYTFGKQRTEKDKWVKSEFSTHLLHDISSLLQKPNWILSLVLPVCDITFIFAWIDISGFTWISSLNSSPSLNLESFADKSFSISNNAPPFKGSKNNSQRLETVSRSSFLHAIISYRISYFRINRIIGHEIHINPHKMNFVTNCPIDIHFQLSTSWIFIRNTGHVTEYQKNFWIF